MIDELELLRAQIDAADKALIASLAGRMDIVRQIGELKRTQGIPVRDDARWKEVVSKAINEARKQSLSETFIEEIFAAIHRAALDIENKNDS